MPATTLCVVVLAHHDATQVVRLRHALEGLPVVLHCDVKSAPETFAAMADPTVGDVRTVDRADTRLASWSLVDAELRALAAAITWTQADYFAICSGSDYPLLPVGEIEREIAGLQGSSWIWNMPIPLDRWNSRFAEDGGMWRFKYRYLRRGANLVHLRGRPVPIPLRRAIPRDYVLRAASQWKIYSLEHAKLILRLVATYPELTRFWRSTYTPDESFVATVLATPRYAGDAVLAPMANSAWHIDWEEDFQQHPEWLTEADYEALRRLAVEGYGGHRVLFARKFRSGPSDAVLDRIDRNLLDATRSVGDAGGGGLDESVS